MLSERNLLGKQGQRDVSGDRAAGPGTGKWKGRRNPTDSGGLDELLRAFRAVLPYSFSKFSAGENEPDMGQPYDLEPAGSGAAAWGSFQDYGTYG